MIIDDEAMTLSLRSERTTRTEVQRAGFSAQFFTCEQTNRITCGRSRPRLPGGGGIWRAHCNARLSRARLRTSLLSRPVVTSLRLRQTEQPGDKREPVGLTVLLTGTTIMKVAARHEAESKIDEQVSCSWRRCRWPRRGLSPRFSRGRCAGRDGRANGRRPDTGGSADGDDHCEGGYSAEIDARHRPAGGTGVIVRLQCHDEHGTPERRRAETAGVSVQRLPLRGGHVRFSRDAADRRPRRAGCCSEPELVLTSSGQQREPVGQVGQRQSRPPRPHRVALRDVHVRRSHRSRMAECDVSDRRFETIR